MLTGHAGNCYDFAAAFAACAARLGYETYVVYGTTYMLAGGTGPHGWVYISGLGIFDPEGTFAGWNRLYASPETDCMEEGRVRMLL